MRAEALTLPQSKLTLLVESDEGGKKEQKQ